MAVCIIVYTQKQNKLRNVKQTKVKDDLSSTAQIAVKNSPVLYYQRNVIQPNPNMHN